MLLQPKDTRTLTPNWSFITILKKSCENWGQMNKIHQAQSIIEKDGHLLKKRENDSQQSLRKLWKKYGLNITYKIFKAHQWVTKAQELTVVY